MMPDPASSAPAPPQAGGRPSLPVAAARAIRGRTLADRLIVFALLIGAWWVGGLLLGTYYLSTPWAVFLRFGEQIADGELLYHAGYTLIEAGIGTLAGGVTAVLLPFLLRRHPIVVAILDPFMIGGYGAPKLALAPLFILWFGIGIESKIALVAAVVFFIVYFSTLAGVRALDAKLVQMAQTAGASEWQVARHIALPAAIPSIFAGFRIAVPYAIGAAVIAELISSNRGLGYLVTTGANNFDTTGAFVAVLAATLLVLAANWIMNTLESLLLRWRPPVEANIEAGT